MSTVARKRPPCACGGEHYGKGKCKKCYMKERNVLPLLTCLDSECVRRVRNPSGFCRDHRPEVTERPCGRCGLVLPVEQFKRHEATTRSEKQGWLCDGCIEAKRQERAIAHHIAGRRFARYGITAERFEELRELQGDRCAICHRGFLGQIDIDHDHNCCPGSKSCGACVRGLLCPQCNKALGLFGDDIEALRSALDYVIKGGVR